MDAITWSQAIKGALAGMAALPELVKLAKPTLEFVNTALYPDPAKKASELGSIIRDFVDAKTTKDVEEQKKKSHDALEKFADFIHRN